MAIKKEKDYLFFEGRKNLVNHDGTVNFGSYNEPLNLNFHDYKLKSLFDKKMCKFRSNNVLKKFTY